MVTQIEKKTQDSLLSFPISNTAKKLNTPSTNLHKSDICNNCGHKGKIRQRTFSKKVWTVLLIWNEIKSSGINEGICDTCYDEMRCILIDRADEIDSTYSEYENKEIDLL